MLYNGRHPVI
jgi:hypothetical protein